MEKYLPTLAVSIAQLNWNWIRLAFKHTLVAALEFACMEDI